jgi:flagellar biosynthesis protein FlhG
MSIDSLTVCITSGKGGVGKTSLTVNLAISIIKQGKKVLIIDGDLGLANVDLFIGLTPKLSLRDVVQHGYDPKGCLCYPRKGLGVLPASSGVPEMVSLGPNEQQRLEGYFSEIFKGFDVILIDTAAGIGASVIWFNTFVRNNLIVITPEPTSITDAYALIKVLSKKFRRTNFQIVVNMSENDKEGRMVFGQFKKVAESFLGVNLRYIGGLNVNPIVSKAVREQRPFFESSPRTGISNSLKKIALEIMALENVPQIKIA